MSIKTPVRTTNEWMHDADGLVLASCKTSGTADAIAHALNTHAALRESHAECVDALRSIQQVINGELPIARNDDDVPVAYDEVDTALSNAAKVEVGHE